MTENSDGKVSIQARGTVTDPKDFSESGGDHRKSVLASTALIIVLLNASKLTPTVFGVEVSTRDLWLLLGAAHVYFFVMWRLTTAVESDADKRFWNLRGLWKQAIVVGTKGFPGKTKAQLIFIRALPIWAFVIGLVGVACRLFYAYTSQSLLHASFDILALNLRQFAQTLVALGQQLAG